MTDLNLNRGITVVLKNALLLLIAISAMGASGCTQKTINGKRLPDTVDQIDKIALLVPQNAIINWDGKPGLDGVIAQVMLFQNQEKGPKSVLVSGEIDLMLFEGRKPKTLNNAPKPFCTKTFTSSELATKIVGQYSSLWSYSLRLPWPKIPATKDVWMIARYRPKSGRAVYSSPAEQRVPTASNRTSN
ncbi:MAG: hypothetical protein HN350_13360 [Phycisphaerales bacterium]|nr:hypothetical protein [Phycisphaerales bacterium]